MMNIQWPNLFFFITSEIFINGRFIQTHTQKKLVNFLSVGAVARTDILENA